MHLAISIVLGALLGTTANVVPVSTSPVQSHFGEASDADSERSSSNRLRTFRVRLKTASDIAPWMSADIHAYSLSVFMSVNDPGLKFWFLEYAQDAQCASGRELIQNIPWMALAKQDEGFLEVTTTLNGPLDINVSGHDDILDNEQDRFTNIQRHANGDVDLNITFLDESNGPGWGIKWADPRPGPMPFEMQLLGDPWRIHLRPSSDCETTYVGAAGELASIPTHVRSTPKEWAVTKPGMLPHYGTSEDFVPAKDGFVMATIEHLPGWGTQLQVVDEQGLALAGAMVIVNEQPLGQSDQDGKFTLRLPAQPTSVRIELGGLVWTGQASWIAKQPWTTAVLE